MFRVLLDASGATELEAQTNMPLMLTMLEAFATEVRDEKLLFADGPATELSIPGAVFRGRKPDDEGPGGEWVVVVDGTVVGGGGILKHYNPPYGDLYMEVLESARRRGVGSFLIQEMRRACREAGRVPAARCDTTNEPSRRTLERGGMVPCGRLVAGRVRG